MSNLSFAILRRLALAGVLACVLVGAGVYFFEGRDVDNFVLMLTTQQSDELTNSAADRDNRTIYANVLDAARRRCVVAQVFDNEWNLRGETANPRYENLRAALVAQTRVFPRNTARHYHTIRDGDVTAIQIQAPILNAAKEPVGILNGVFVVPERIEQQLRQRIRYALLAILAAVLMTAVALYPMILSLNRKVLRASHKIMRGNLETAVTLGTAIAKRDSDTGAHNYRVCHYAMRLGEAAGLDTATMRRLIIGSFFHDIGKIGISDAILLKPGKLSDEEFAVMKQHVSLGLEIVHSSEWLRAGSDVIEFHHEKFDGKGYLKQLKGEEIPLVARIFAIVDVFDALASRRPYKEPMSSAEALAKVREGADSHFDPRLVTLFAGIAEPLHKEITSLDEEQVSKMLLQKVTYYFLLPDNAPLLP